MKEQLYFKVYRIMAHWFKKMLLKATPVPELLRVLVDGKFQQPYGVLEEREWREYYPALYESVHALQEERSSFFFDYHRVRALVVQPIFRAARGSSIEQEDERKREESEICDSLKSYMELAGYTGGSFLVTPLVKKSTRYGTAIVVLWVPKISSLDVLIGPKLELPKEATEVHHAQDLIEDESAPPLRRVSIKQNPLPFLRTPVEPTKKSLSKVEEEKKPFVDDAPASPASKSPPLIRKISIAEQSQVVVKQSPQVRNVAFVPAQNYTVRPKVHVGDWKYWNEIRYRIIGAKGKSSGSLTVRQEKSLLKISLLSVKESSQSQKLIPYTEQFHAASSLIENHATHLFDMEHYGISSFSFEMDMSYNYRSLVSGINTYRKNAIDDTLWYYYENQREPKFSLLPDEGGPDTFVKIPVNTLQYEDQLFLFTADIPQARQKEIQKILALRDVQSQEQGLITQIGLLSGSVIIIERRVKKEMLHASAS